MIGKCLRRVGSAQSAFYRNADYIFPVDPFAVIRDFNHNPAGIVVGADGECSFCRFPGCRPFSGGFYAVVQGVVLCTASFYILLNLAADLLYAAINPRLRA